MLHYLLFVLAQIFSLQSDSVANLESACHNEIPILNPAKVAYYDGMVKIDLSKIRPMIAMPFHPSNTYTIEDMNKNLMDVLHDCEQKALVSLDGQVFFSRIFLRIFVLR